MRHRRRILRLRLRLRLLLRRQLLRRTRANRLLRRRSRPGGRAAGGYVPAARWSTCHNHYRRSACCPAGSASVPRLTQAALDHTPTAPAYRRVLEAGLPMRRNDHLKTQLGIS